MKNTKKRIIAVFPIPGRTVTAKKIEFKRFFAAVLCLILTITVFTLPASAAAAGTTMDNPISIKMDKDYTKSWTKKTRKVNCFNKIKITDRGFLTITAKKPYDSDGKIGSLLFSLYDTNGDLIWDNGSSGSTDDASTKYIKTVGLDAGTYYLNIKFDSYIISGTFKTTYSMSFKKNKYCEIESNDSSTNATEMVFGKYYTGVYGGGWQAEKNDFYKFQVKEGNYYALQFQDYEEIDRTSARCEILNTSTKSIRTEEVVLSNGNTALAFKAGQTGYMYLKMRGYRKAPFTYKIAITNYTNKEDPVELYNVYETGDEKIYVSWHTTRIKLVDGYQINYSLNSSFKGGTKEIVQGLNTHWYKFEPEYYGTYYVRIRTYRQTEKGIVYGEWSDVYSVDYF